MPADSPVATPDVAVSDAVRAFAFIGDLSMGRPTDHSHRTARLAGWLALASGGQAAEQQAAEAVALLRWSGCTANAAGFDQLLGDDVAGREQMFAQTLRPLSLQEQRAVAPLAEIHCEVSGDIARQLGMGAAVEAGLRQVFERWDGGGQPGQLGGEAVPAVVYQVAIASELEILSQVHGQAEALARVRAAGGSRYPAALATLACSAAADWLAALDEPSPARETVDEADRRVPLALVADVADLKLPWLAGQSRQVAEAAQATARLLGLDEDAAAQLHRAGLLHGIGRAALPNHLWNKAGRLLAGERERLRLMPYWTFRAAGAIQRLKTEAELASHAWEKLDGSGAFRSLSGAALSQAQRVLATAAALVALRSPRPWRLAHDADAAAQLLRGEATRGMFDPAVVEAAIAAAAGARPRAPARAAVTLSGREADVLRRISLGESNKEVARALSISPSTVRTHIESVFRKLECSTRAAATLKAFTLGLL
ncbi:LuxR C-terminal-related transcriptional regulator [Ideonella azotifigens]|uniref:HD domain-containing protein n=1 Tax=Ideonella azotifigens TaxID=513160 RepID=A0ABN1KLJ0_9BURK|nr:HD domain-containing phosphohydrolase [Ideonella azotifigens]MCD2344768.1 LuxR C-terminal-related transcriptional regulator [Ideonella azotifigens]